MRIKGSCMTRIGRSRAFIVLGLIIWACDGDGPSEPRPAATSIDVTGGSGQGGAVGQPLPEQVVFEVLDQHGRPMAAVPVTVQVIGGGSIAGGPAFNTDQQGRIRVSWTLGTAVGGQSLRAAIPGDTATATATASAGSVATLEKLSGDEQRAPAGTTLGAPLVVRLRDAFGNAAANVTVVWAVGGAGVVNPVSATTDAAGIANTSWRLGPSAGLQTVVASHGSLNATFTATATATTAGTVAALQVVQGNNQVDTVAQVLPAPLGVRAVDAVGNPVPGVSITFVVTSGGGSVFLGTTITSADGVALEQWRLGTSTSVAQQLEARAIDPSNGSSLSAPFTATPLPATPAELVPVSAAST